MKKTVKPSKHLGNIPTRAPFSQYKSDLGSRKRSGVAIEVMKAIGRAVSFKKKLLTNNK